MKESKDVKLQKGLFCDFFGNNARNRILEHFLEMRNADFPIGDIAKEIGLNRTTTYTQMEELLKEKIIIPTRKVSGGQLYKLNQSKESVKTLLVIFDLIINQSIKSIIKREKLLEIMD